MDDSAISSDVKMSQVFYATPKDPHLSGRQRVVADLSGQDGFVKVALPPNAESFRLDIALPENILPSNKTMRVRFLLGDQAVCKELQFRPEKPYYAWGNFKTEEFRRTVFRGYKFLSLYFLLCLVAYLPASRMAAGVQGKSLWSLAMAFLFIMCLGLPSAKIDTESDKSAFENRMLAKFPSLDVLADGVSSYCREFERAFTDRLWCRESLVGMHSAIKSVFEDRGNDKVEVGTDGWLFFKQTLEDYSNSNEDDFCAGVYRYITALAEYARSSGKLFAVVVAPDKCRVYPEHVRFRRKVRPDSDSRTARIVARLRAQGEYPVFYQREELIGVKGACQALLYHKCDTHWTCSGAYHGEYRPVAEWLKSVCRSFTPLDRISWKRQVRDRFDLSRMLGRAEVPDPNYVVQDIPGSAAITRSSKNKGNHIQARGTTDNPNGTLRLFCIRDSFTGACIPFLESTFRHCYFKHYLADFSKEDLEELGASDVVLLEIVERDIECLASCKPLSIVAR